MDNGSKNGSRGGGLQSGNLMGVAAVIVVGIFVICVIIVLAKGLFKSNSSSVPDGVYTGTIAPEMSVAQTVTSEDNKESGADPSSTDSTDSKSDSEASSQAAEDSKAEDSSGSSAAEAQGDKAYVTEYAYLRTEPDQNAQQIVCMSPNIEVTVLERGIDGYCKVTFMNVDGQLTGYVYEGYLSETPIY